MTPRLVVTDEFPRLPSAVYMTMSRKERPKPIYVENRMPLYRWNVPPAADEVIEFFIERSINNGRTFEPIATVPNNTDPAHFDADKNKFFFNEPNPHPASILRIAGRNETGLGPWAYMHSPPTPIPVTNVYGTIMTPRGQPIRGARVSVRTVAPKAMPNAGTPGYQNERVLVMGDTSTIHTDEHGRWQVNLAQGIVVSIAFEGKKYTFRVPMGLDVLNISDWARYAAAER